MKLKNKFFILFIFTIFIIMLLISTKTYATNDTFEITFTYDDETYTFTNVPHLSDKFIIQKWNYDRVFFIKFYEDSLSKFIFNGNYFTAVDVNGNSVNELGTYRGNYGFTTSVWNSYKSNLDNNWFYSYAYSSVNVIDKTQPYFYCFPEKEYITLENFKFSQILSTEYDLENYDNYNAYVSFDNDNWNIMNKEKNEKDNYFVFYYDVFENGSYQVKIFDDVTGSYIYDSSVEVDNIPFTITLEPSEDTDEPIIARTNRFPFDVSLKYSFHFSTDKEEWTKLNHSTEAPSETEEVYSDDTYYWTRIFKNGTYYFRFTYYEEEYDENNNLISSTPNYFYVTKKVENILVEDYMSDNYIFKPIISLDFNEETQAFVVRTQSILLDKALNLNCFYIAYEKTDGFNPNEEIYNDVITGWNKMEIDFENNIYMNTSDAYFYFEIPIVNATDTNYKIAFYNYISEKASEIVYYDFVYEDAKNYVENDLKAHLGINVALNDLLKSIESHFGVLGFPMAVVRNFCNKILTLQTKEPIIYIPELYEPFYNNKIFNGISFNFNSLLVNDSVIFIHEFYLTIVDVIFIYLFLVYCVKTLKSFIGSINNND